jgi:hypothetical protein
MNHITEDMTEKTYRKLYVTEESKENGFGNPVEAQAHLFHSLYLRRLQGSMKLYLK